MSTLLPLPVYPSVRTRPASAAFSRQVVGLDLLRIAAAALVVVYHLCFYDWTPRAHSPGSPLHAFDRLSAFTNFGWVGVEIFFVISGFVIAFSAQTARASTFALQRLLRLLPAAFLCASLSAVALYAQGATSLGAVAWLWLRSICLRPLPGVDGSYWTLPIELAFYGLVFLLIALRQVRRLPAVVGALGAFSTSLWVLMPMQRHLPTLLNDWYFQPLLRTAMQTQSLVWFGSSFAVGVFLWLCLMQRCTWQRLFMLGLCGIGTLGELLLRGNTLAHECATRYRPVLPAALWLSSVAFIVFATRYNTQVQSWLGRGGVALCRRLGLLTYPLYLVHHTVGFTLIQRLRPYLGAAGALLLALAAVVTAAYLIAAYPERAIQRRLRARIEAWTKQVPKLAFTPPPAAGPAVPAAFAFLQAHRPQPRSTRASAAHPAA